MKLRAAKGEAAASENELREYAGGLVCLTGGDDGPLALAFRKGTSEQTAARLTDIYGKGNVYAELQRHYSRDEEARNQAVMDVAARWRFPLLATNGVRYAAPGQRELFDAAHLCAPQDDDCRSGPAAGAKLRTIFETGARNGAAVRGYSRCRGQHGGIIRPARIHAG